jgi:hypothetical protein
MPFNKEEHDWLNSPSLEVMTLRDTAEALEALLDALEAREDRVKNDPAWASLRSDPEAWDAFIAARTKAILSRSFRGSNK